MDADLKSIIDLQDNPPRKTESNWPLLGLLGGLFVTGMLIFGGGSKEQEEKKQVLPWPWEPTADQQKTTREVLESQKYSITDENAPVTALAPDKPKELESATPVFEKPAQCYDPILLENKPINDQVTTFYYVNAENRLQSTACVDNDDLPNILKNNDYLFQKCQENNRPDLESYGSEDGLLLRKLPFQIPAYIMEDEAKQIVPGKQYILVPTRRKAGRLMSVSQPARLCKDAQNDLIYSLRLGK
jgi:hypothetical protein